LTNLRSIQFDRIDSIEIYLRKKKEKEIISLPVQNIDHANGEKKIE